MFLLPCVQLDVTITAKADHPWLWGMQSAVESIFIAQVREDITTYLEYTRQKLNDAYKAGKVRPPSFPVAMLAGDRLML